MAASPPLPPDDDSQSEGQTVPSVAPGIPTPTPTAPADQDSTRGTSDPRSTLISLMNQRSGNPTDLGLRDQEHAAFSKYLLHTLGPLLGTGVVAASVPAYSAAKAVAQPLGLMKDATPASMQEVKAGLSPILPQINPELANKLLTLMKMWGIGPQQPDKQVLLGTR